MGYHEKMIIRPIKKGDKACFGKLFEMYYQRLSCYANSYLDDPDAAEDLVQDMFIHLWEKRNDLVIFSSISSYLFRAMHNRCIQHLRHKKVGLKYRELHRFGLREAEILYNNSYRSDGRSSERRIRIAKPANALIIKKPGFHAGLFLW